MGFSIRLAPLAVVLGMAARLAAQHPEPSAAHVAEMKKLDFLAGEWKGAGWMQMPGGRSEFSQTEVVQKKLHGVALVIEGRGTSKESGRVVHDALAMVTWDEPSKEYRFQSWLFNRPAGGDFRGRVLGENTFQWSMQPPGMTIRYTIRLNEKKQWHEVGEMSRDGQSWQKIFEMTLDKVKQAP